MGKLVLDEDFGVTALKDIPVVSSRRVADVFGKEHKNVLAIIANLIEPTSGLSEGFSRLNFKPSSYKDSRGKKQPEVLMTFDGFILLTMGFTGKNAVRVKEAYINRFNEMKRFIESRYAARLESRELTDAIQVLHDPAMHYHYSNEFDMINKIVLGMRSREFRLKHGIPKDVSIRDYLSPQQIDAIAKLQAFDAHLAKVIPDYRQRQGLLQEYYQKITVSVKAVEA